MCFVGKVRVVERKRESSSVPSGTSRVQRAVFSAEKIDYCVSAALALLFEKAALS